MKYRFLGKESVKVSAVGLGCMSVSPFYGKPDEQESTHTIRSAFEMGVNFFDTSDLYGFGHSEELVGRALKPIRDKVILATKGGLVVDSMNDKPVPCGVNTTPKYIRKTVDASLKRLKTDYIDLYYLHRIDPITPLEETMGELKKLIAEGKIRYIGLSEANEKQIRISHEIHPITALQSEYSLWFRRVENKILPLCKELNIGFVPFSPLGRGFLTGSITSTDSLEDYDFRKDLPRFSEENIKKNYAIIEQIKLISDKNKCSIAQLALAWILAKGDNIIPIPGISKLTHLQENISAIDISLNKEDLKNLDDICTEENIAGKQFTEGALRIFNTFASYSR